MDNSGNPENMKDISLVLEDAASLLTYESSMLHTQSFTLQDSMAALEIMDLIFYIMMIFTNELYDYGIAFSLCEMCSAFTWTTLAVYGIEVKT